MKSHSPPFDMSCWLTAGIEPACAIAAHHVAVRRQTARSAYLFACTRTLTMQILSMRSMRPPSRVTFAVAASLESP